MAKEYGDLDANGTWDLVDLPPGKKAIGCRWVMVIMRKADGSVDHYKARLVARGDRQRPGFNYIETFTPTLHWATLKAILAISALEDLELHSIDISQAYINGELDVEIFMEQPAGFTNGNRSKVL